MKWINPWLLSIFFLIILWAILNIWREISIQKENWLSYTHLAYQRALQSNNSNTIKQFEPYKKYFKEYFFSKKAETDKQIQEKSKGMNTYKAKFGYMKLDKGMIFARFPVIWFNIIFSTLLLVFIIISIKKVTIN